MLICAFRLLLMLLFVHAVVPGDLKIVNFELKVIGALAVLASRVLHALFTTGKHVTSRLQASCSLPFE